MLIVKAVILGILLGAAIWAIGAERNKRKCIDSAVIVQSFDVCNDKLQGCFFIYEDVLKVGRAIKYRQDHCKTS